MGNFKCLAPTSWAVLGPLFASPIGYENFGIQPNFIFCRSVWSSGQDLEAMG